MPPISLPTRDFFDAPASPMPGSWGDALGIWNRMIAATLDQLGAAPLASAEIDGSGSLDVQKGCVAVQTAGGAATDDLDRMTLNVPDGWLVMLVLNDDEKTVTVRHAQGGDGEIVLAGAASVAMSNKGDTLLLQRVGSQYHERRLIGTAAGGAASSGAALLVGEGAPADGLGQNGDIYLDMSGGPNLWGPKASGTWTGTGPISLKGATGEASVDLPDRNVVYVSAPGQMVVTTEDLENSREIICDTEAAGGNISVHFSLAVTGAIPSGSTRGVRIKHRGPNETSVTAEAGVSIQAPFGTKLTVSDAIGVVFAYSINAINLQGPWGS